MVFGVVGVKVFVVIEDILALLADLVGILLFGGGLVIYGGLIFGFFFVVLYLRWKNIFIVYVLDVVVLALIIVYGVGWLGCYFFGDGDWGIVNVVV